MRVLLALVLVAFPAVALAQDAAFPPSSGDAGERAAATTGVGAQAEASDGVGGSGKPLLPAHERPIVWVDPGHGGKMEGAVGHKGVLEKAVALQISKRLEEELARSLGARVLLSREGDQDVELSERMRRANEAGAQVFVSVHCNAMPLGPTRAHAKGVETYFLSAEATGEQARRVAAAENAEARKVKASKDPLANILDDLATTEAHRDASALAYAVHQQLIKDLGATDRGVHQAPFIVLMGAQMPAVLVEVGFLTNPAEAALLTDKEHQGKVARSLAAGIASWLDEVARRRMPLEQLEPPVRQAEGGAR
ncbi:MAG: N-acetylmuramoyl-L-alanine amidase [Deltaproteobacteria bacterium]|nr:N-acetylmuramoyl-L-alanine amidase [Deltaproteobacteria bacterium]